MAFHGYKYKFNLYAAHSNMSYGGTDTHFHNFTITLYVNSINKQVDENYNLENVVNEWLQKYRNRPLHEFEIFNGKETSIESMGDTFYDHLCELIENEEYELIRLDIEENPIRSYSVSKYLLDKSVNRVTGIPLDCVSFIDLNRKSQEDALEDYEQEAAAAIEPKINEEESTVDEKDITLLDDTDGKVNLVSYDNTEDTNTKEAIDSKEENKDRIHVPHVQEDEKNSKFRLPHLVKLVLAVVALVTFACITMYSVKISGRYPQGSDTLCHLYRADLILENIKVGNWYPLYDGSWYNGVEIMRYWGPLPLYVIAGLEWLIGSSVLDAYILYLGALIVIGGCGWLLFGYRYKRIGLATILGLMWFYFPENIRVVVQEGNLPRGLINALFPFFFYFLWRLVEEKNKKSFIPLAVVTSLITLCHMGMVLMLIATVAIFLFIHGLANRSVKWELYSIGSCISGIMIVGVWVVPSLIGGAASSGKSTNQVMQYFFQSGFKSLNPFLRLNGDILSFYFGLSVFLVCVLGVMLGTKKVRTGFLTVIIIFLCTTKSVYHLFVKLPFSQFMWMIRFIPAVLALALVSFFMWRQLKKWVVILICALLILDCIPSYQHVYFTKEDRVFDAEKELEERAERTLITKAKELTKQRMALLDLSTYGSFAPYYIAGVGKRVDYTFGAGWEGANTASNIVALNSSVENGWYTYLFDRAIELGNDTVLVPVSSLKRGINDVERLKEAANLFGFNLIESTKETLLFHKNTIDSFGVISEYENIAIGASADSITRIYPSFKESLTDNLNAYTFEELMKYKNIYLSGFTYTEKEKAEEMLLKLAQAGVKIYIDMGSLPENKAKKQMEFLGVTARTISFQDTYPMFYYFKETYTSLEFPEELSQWNTVYLDGLDNVEGFCNMADKELPYIGTSGNDNIHFIGLNLIYYLEITNDSVIGSLVDRIFSMDGKQVPTRELVPITVEKEINQVMIQSEYDNVNTTLAHIDIFESEQYYTADHGLLVVDKGTTVIKMKYPHLTKGLMVSSLGVFLMLALYWNLQRTIKKGGVADEE